MWDAIGSSPKKFSLSAAEWVVALDEKKVDGVRMEEKFPVGMVIEKVKVVRMDDEWGLTVEILQEGEEQREAGFVHVRLNLCLPASRRNADLKSRMFRSLVSPTITSTPSLRMDLGKLRPFTKHELSATLPSMVSFNSVSSLAFSRCASSESSMLKLEK